MTSIDDFLQFRESFCGLKGKAKKFFLDGKITFLEASEFSMLPRSEHTRIKTKLMRQHLKRHDQMIRVHTGIDLPAETIDGLLSELETMPAHISRSVMAGKITIIQARHAARLKLGGKPVKKICFGNMPPKFLDRPRVPSSESSVRAPVRVRPRNRFAHGASR